MVGSPAAAASRLSRSRSRSRSSQSFFKIRRPAQITVQRPSALLYAESLRSISTVEDSTKSKCCNIL